MNKRKALLLASVVMLAVFLLAQPLQAQEKQHAGEQGS